MKKKNVVSKKVLIFIIVVSILFLLSIILAFVCYSANNKKKESTVHDSGSIVMTYSNSSNSLTIDNSVLLSDKDGILVKDVNHYFDFTVNTVLKDSKMISYEISIMKDPASTIADDKIRVYLEKQTSGTFTKVFEPQQYIPLAKKSDIGSPAGSMVLFKGISKSDSSDNYRLRIWVSNDVQLDNSQLGNYTLSVDVYGKAQ